MPSDLNAKNDKLTEYMLPRFAGLVSVVKNYGNDEVYPICTGIVTILKGHPVLVTVAHYLKDVLKWQKQNRLEQLALIVHRDAIGASPLIVDLHPECIAFSEVCDIGCLILSHDEVNAFRKHGGVVLDAATLTDVNESSDVYVLAGHSAALSKISSDTISMDKGAQQKWELMRLSSIAVALVNVTGFEKGSETAIRYHPKNHNLDTYEGMSGGPVFEFRRGDENLEIAICAFQSKQVTKGESFVALIGTPGDVAAKEIERLLDELGARVM